MKIQYFLGTCLLLVIAPIAWSANHVTIGASVGFHWKPYNGTIPEDAVPGTDDETNPRYIGRGPVWEGGLLLGELLAGVPFLTVTGPPINQVHVIDQNVEILCSENPTAFEWIIRNTGESIHSDSPSLVQGGYEKSGLRPIFVARARVPVKRGNGEDITADYDIRVAKVTLNEPQRDKYDLFFYPDGKQEGSSEAFEVLTVA